MRQAPRFWQKRGALAYLFWPFGALYGAITLLRMRQTGYKAAIPVLCVGNVTLGGTGKTPVVQAIYVILQEMGVKTVILTRGYGGQVKDTRLVKNESAQDIGDEAALVAQDAPVIVSQHRAKGAKLAVELGFSCILMDDGFQNPQLHKDFSFLVFDKGGIGNGFVFPAGELRAALNPQLAQAQAVIFTGEGALNLPTDLPSFETEPLAVTLLPRETKLLAFCGIGKPAKFFEMLATLGFKDVETRSFPDHFIYQEKDIVGLKRKAKAQNRTLITTQKDAVKWPEPIEIVEFKLAFKNKEAIKAILSPLFHASIVAHKTAV